MEPILGRTASGPRQKYRCPLGHTRYFPTKKMRHFFYCNRMAVPRRNAYPVGIRANLYRSNSGSERAVAQLTILIITPGPQRTVCFNRNGMVTAACYMQSPCANLDGDVATDKCSMSQLSIGILTPRPQRTIVLHRNGHGDSPDVVEVAIEELHLLFIRRIGRDSDIDLASDRFGRHQGKLRPRWARGRLIGSATAQQPGNPHGRGDGNVPKNHGISPPHVDVRAFRGMRLFYPALPGISRIDSLSL